MLEGPWSRRAPHIVEAPVKVAVQIRHLDVVAAVGEAGPVPEVLRFGQGAGRDQSTGIEIFDGPRRLGFGPEAEEVFATGTANGRILCRHGGRLRRGRHRRGQGRGHRRGRHVVVHNVDVDIQSNVADEPPSQEVEEEPQQEHLVDVPVEGLVFQRSGVTLW